MGGENGAPRHVTRLPGGSSPRGRGKLVPCAGIPGVAGLIPAWAGKTFGEATEMHASWAHPRVGGENETRHAYYESVTGSSPRGRGKLPFFTFLYPLYLAHPRVGGENSRASVGTLLGTGSSPRGRGKRSRAWSPPPTPGLIPAWAGKTTRGQACTWRERAHPRVGGENM